LSGVLPNMPYMMTGHECPGFPNRFPLNPRTMEGYRYIFHGEKELASLLPPTTPECRLELNEVTRSGFNTLLKRGKVTVKYTTIDSVWRWIETQGVYTKEAMDTMKDVALSFTLFKLLKRRLCGYRIGEAGLAKTLDFVLRGLIFEEGNYARAFGVVEMELAFLYDFLYTGFDAKSGDYKGLAFYFVVTVAAWNGISRAFRRHYHRSNLEQSVPGTDVTRWVTIVLLTVVLALSCSPGGRDTRWLVVHQLQLMDDPIYGLERAMGSWKHDLPRVKREAKKSWQRALGQYSLLLNFDYRPRNVLPLLSRGLVDATRQGHKAGEKVVLSDEVIVRVLSGFKESNGELGDGRSALARNQQQLGSHELSWACTMPAHIDKILVWHIGTTIAMDGHPVPTTGDQRVAKTLSDYCAYLVAFVPDMLPGHGYDTQRVLDGVVVDARESLAGCDTVSSRCEKLMMMGLLPSNSTCTVLEMGGRLGRELRDVVPEARRWKLLADFWAEFVLFLAPSDNAEIHAEKLAAGGEFMTHLWALLTHAGILEQPPVTPPV
jgi:hypothetical protein